MKTFVYSVFDDKAEVFMPPFYQSTSGMAMRVFADACRQTDHPFHQNPGDYHLYEIGTFQNDTGALLGYENVKLLINAVDAGFTPSEPQIQLKEVN